MDLIHTFEFNSSKFPFQKTSVNQTEMLSIHLICHHNYADFERKIFVHWELNTRHVCKYVFHKIKLNKIWNKSNIKLLIQFYGIIFLRKEIYILLKCNFHKKPSKPMFN